MMTALQHVSNSNSNLLTALNGIIEYAVCCRWAGTAFEYTQGSQTKSPNCAIMAKWLDEQWDPKTHQVLLSIFKSGLTCCQIPELTIALSADLSEMSAYEMGS